MAKARKARDPVVSGGFFPSSGLLASDAPSPGAMPLVSGGRSAAIAFDPGDERALIRAIGDLRADFESVSGDASALIEAGGDGSLPEAASSAVGLVIVGGVGRSRLVAALAARGLLDASRIRGRWEAFMAKTVERPFPGVERALVIAGSDARGAIYGIYELSAQIGVSPWHWWADLVPEHKNALWAQAADVAEPGPAVRYRGIFLNDEEPCLGPWARETFGGLNAAFYAKVFELVLRLRGNYLWPAMWGKSIIEDDPASADLAAEYGIVLGTSHHEPLMRAHVDWSRNGKGPWNYAKNGEFLRGFWREGMRRTKGLEKTVTIGMRGDGDEPMSEEEDVALLQRIVGDQRAIIAEETGRPAEETTQVWALYKEVQGYYERGMRVPDDVTLLWCDDNWGNIRRLPTEEERSRPGGAGIYYHFDYVGGPRSYKWMNSSTIERTWEQMHQAYRYGATRLWVVNVGDLKPLEYPIDFFLSYAWNPEAMDADDLGAWARCWAARAFGRDRAKEIAEIMSLYPKWNMRRKPELLDPDSYSAVNYREAETVVAGWKRLVERTAAIHESLPETRKAAFYQLVYHPVAASAVLHALQRAAALNRLHAAQGRASANAMAEKARRLFREDAELSRRYHEELSGGKWNHLMAQPHIGYYYWNYPVRNVMPAVHEVQPSAKGEMGVAIEGVERSWPDWWPNKAVLPAINPIDGEGRWLEVFNRGLDHVDFAVKADKPWVTLSANKGRLGPDARVMVGARWKDVAPGDSGAVITVSGSDGTKVEVELPLEWRAGLPAVAKGTFVQRLGHVSMEAEHYASAAAPQGRTWKRIPNYGRSLSGMAAFPVLAPALEPGEGGMRLEYRMLLAKGGAARVYAIFGPTIDFRQGGGFRFALSVDGGAPLVVNAHADRSDAAWERAVSDEALVASAELYFGSPGEHALSYWMLDTGLVLEKLVVDFGGMKKSYLYPPESHRV